MKAIILKSAPAGIGGGLNIPLTRICADSAVGRDTMPLFVPDIPLGWYARVCPAFRISRLGKHISDRFALRYIDGVTAVCLLCSTDDVYIKSGLAAIIDSAVTTGRFVDWTPGMSALDIDINGTILKIDTEAISLDAAISGVSTATTLKSGDLVIFEDYGADIPLTPDAHITADIGGIQCLNLKVK